MDSCVRSLIFTVLVLYWNVSVLHCHQSDDLVNFYESHDRAKRQVPPGMGGESCLQIYSVPRKSVVCEPTQEVRDDLVDLRQKTEENKAAHESLTARVDELDPDKPRELPQDVKDRLDTIDEVKQNQAGHAEYLKRLEGEIEHVIERMERIESSDRTELARLIELQTRLIQLTLHQSNTSLHDAYIDKLTESTHDLTNKLKDLELDLKTAIHDSESKLEDDVKKTKENSRTSMHNLEETLRETLDKFEERLGRESSIRLRYQNQTDGNYRELVKLVEAVTSIREHQTEYDDNEAKLKARIEELEGKLVTEREEKIELQGHTNKLQNSLEVLEGSFVQLREELGKCRNQTTILSDEFKALTKAVLDKEHLMPRTLKVGDCQDALNYFHPASGIYAINIPPLTQPFDVYCDMVGSYGWTVIQRRQDGSVDFFRGWQHYKDGFGDVSAEFWLGLTKIHAMTNRKSYRLRIDLRDWDDKWYHAEYSQFRIDTEENNYKLYVSGYQGDAGDSLSYHAGMAFSTMDRNNDENAGICATWCHGAWWYKDCFHSNLNGRYYNKGPYMTKTGWGDGVVWRHIQGTNYYSMKSVVMKIRPNDQRT